MVASLETAPAFDAIHAWAKDLGPTALPYALKVVEQILAETDVKTRVLVQLLVRQRLQCFSDMAARINDYETMLFDKKSVEYFDVNQKIAAYKVMVSREATAAKQAIDGSKHEVHVGQLQQINVLNEAASLPDPFVKQVDEKVIQAVTQLANMVAQKQIGIVSEPPQ